MEVVGLFLMATLIIGAGVLALWIGIEESKRRAAVAEERQKNSIAWLRKEREAVRLRNDIATVNEQAELRPLVLETKKAILQGKADKRLLDAVFARRALDDVLGAGGPPQEPDPLEGARVKLLTEIENRKADGKETADLDAVLRVLRSIGGGVA